MYIEQIPLEDNQKYLPGTKNIVESIEKSIANLKAFINGVGVDASPHLELRVQANAAPSITPFFYTNGVDKHRNKDLHKVNGTEEHSEHLEEDEYIKHNIVQLANVDEEEGEEEQYRLVDLIETWEEVDQPKPSAIEKCDAATNVNLENPNTCSKLDGNYDCIITIEDLQNAEEITNHNTQPASTSKPTCDSKNNFQRKKRPLPDLLPIETYIINSSIILPNSATTEQIYNSVHETRAIQSRSYYYHWNNDDFIESSFAEDVNVPSNPSDKPIYSEQNIQMGLGFIEKILQTIGIKVTNTNNTDERKRKRRLETENQEVNATSPQLFKYRKVENRFPKFIPNPLEDENPLGSDGFSFNQNRSSIYEQYNLPKSSSGFQSPSVMAQRESFAEKVKPRKSIFNAPPTTHKLVKNTTYADLEFSDDDEPEFLSAPSTSRGYLATMNAPSASQQVPNIPIRYSTAEKQLFAKQQSSLRSDIRGGNSILASSLNQQKTVPTYADVLRQNRASVGEGVSSVSSFPASSSASVRDFSCLNRNIASQFTSYKPKSHSILIWEEQNKERERYKQLLEQTTSRSNGGAERNIRSELNKFTSDLGLPRRRNEMNTATSTVISSRKPLGPRNEFGHRFKQPHPLSSTINLEEDDDDDEVRFTGISQIKNHHPMLNGGIIPIVNDDDVIEVVDLIENNDKQSNKNKKVEKLPYVEPVNTLKERFLRLLQDNWMECHDSQFFQQQKSRNIELEHAKKDAEKAAADRLAATELELGERFRRFGVVDNELFVFDDFPVVKEVPEFIELTAEQNARIKAAIFGQPDEVLITKFNLNITRRDIHTLTDQNWLNDEIINFYMNLLTERSEKKVETHGFPRVYAMNTFFVPRLLQAGHSGVKRWTRKVDILSKDIIPVPVHVGGIHWCMAIIHLKNRSIKYYDSMGSPSPSVLRALEQYIKDESLDKRKQTFDTSNFLIESVKDVPHQMNGSDCGVFSCMFAEYITRNKEITFTQEHMEYFRQKMILEIVQGELLY